MDILGAPVGLTLTGLRFIPIAIALKRDSPGPLFFSQTRCGWMGRRFKLWKFRSMVVDTVARRAEGGGGYLQGPKRSAHHQGEAFSAAHQPGRIAAILECTAGFHEPGRPAPADIKSQIGSISIINDSLVVFNIAGNKL